MISFNPLLFFLLIFFSVTQSWAGKQDKLNHFNLGINYTFSLPYDEDFERNDYRLSHGAGLRFSTNNNKGWGYTSGIYYYTIRTKFFIDFTKFIERDPSAPGEVIDTTLRSGNYKNIKHFFEVPFLMNYTFKLKKFNLKLDVGYILSYIFSYKSNATFKYFNGNTVIAKRVYDLREDRFCLYPTLSLGIEKNFKNFGVHVTPSLRYGIMRYSDYDWLLGFTFGVYKSL